jgi:hypothetical protein
MANPGVCRQSPKQLKTGNLKPWAIIEKLATGQMWAKIYSQKPSVSSFRQIPRRQLPEPNIKSIGKVGNFR